jgi:hypothetical protein
VNSKDLQSATPEHMPEDAHPVKSRARSLSSRIVTRLLILILLCTVAGLSTGAKNSLYYPRTNAVHYLSAACKIKVAAAPQPIDRTLLQSVAVAIEPQPQIRTGLENQTEAPPVQSVSVTVALQHRSPPLLI